MSRRARRAMANALLLLVAAGMSFVLGTAVVETVYWFALTKDERWHDVNTRFDPLLGWRPIPSRTIDEWNGVSSNSLGHRSPELMPGPPVVAVAGDSVAFGYGVSDDETLGHYLAGHIAKHGLQVQNLGVSGYGLGQTHLWLHERLDDLKPLHTVVLVIYTGNDLRETGSNSSWGKSKPLYVMRGGTLALTHTPVSKYSLQNLLSKSQLLDGLRRSSASANQLADQLAGQVTLSVKESTRVATALVVSIAELARSHGARLLVVLSPWAGDFERKTEDLVFFQQMLKHLGLPVVDFYEIARARGWSPEDLFVDVTHLSPQGNERLAASIADWLEASTAGDLSTADPPPESRGS
ncbi:SGNH/GDSL hydrolase family protein [Myxococcota bacterium]|nr:SGNH/GDSL hydrolase family protein [Myxococcota bacterium]